MQNLDIRVNPCHPWLKTGHHPHGDPHPANAGLAAHDLGIVRDALEAVHDGYSASTGPRSQEVRPRRGQRFQSGDQAVRLALQNIIQRFLSCPDSNNSS